MVPDYKEQYRVAAGIAFGAGKILDRCMPVTADDAAWEKWQAAVQAVNTYASYMYTHPFNPVVAEAHVRGDYADFLAQLERNNEGIKEMRKRKGWTKKQVREALPVIRNLAELSDD